jgi:LmbE family N-acetylglucosaminyl deacetylase
VKTLIIAPHPDDELLGVGGTLLRRKQEGGTVVWLIVTAILEEYGWSKEKIATRQEEIRRVAEFTGIDEVVELKYPTTHLDTSILAELVAAIGGVIDRVRPEEVFVPHIGDVHSDHYIVHKAAISNSKWFRHDSIKRLLAYETLSETDFGLEQDFSPNVFVNIEEFLEEKLQALEIYRSEMGSFPFPRSREAVSALAKVRGAASGFAAAEAFRLLRERHD